MKKLIIFSLALLTLASCDPGKKSSTRVTTSPVSDVSGTIAGLALTNQCANGQSGIGSVFDSGSQVSLEMTGSFEDRVKAFLSATVAWNDVGQISGQQNAQTGVRFQGVVKLDGSGNVVAAQSKMVIAIYDSFVLQSQLNPNGQQYQPITITFKPGSNVQTTGQFNMQTGDGFVSFRDAYGEVRFEGRLDAQNFTGVVRFSNTQNVNGSANMSGILGQFMVARCGIIQ